MSDRMPGRMPVKISDQLPDKMSTYTTMSENASIECQNVWSDKMSECMSACQNMRRITSHTISEYMSQYAPGWGSLGEQSNPTEKRESMLW